MKLFLVKIIRKRNTKLTFFLFIAVFFHSCATYKPQYGKETSATAQPVALSDTLSHRFYLIGDAGYATEPITQQLLQAVSAKLKTEGKNTSLLYLGDNIYPLGMPPKGHKDRDDAETGLNSQMALAKLFTGKTYFIPGNHDWYHGLEGLEEQNDYIEDRLKDNKSFLPGKGCGIDDLEINDNVTLIVIDSQWFIENWDKYPTINDNCDIKTREAMFTEFESLLNKNQDKTIIVAIHHPLMTKGSHGGEFSLKKQIFPLKYKVPMPVLGTMINVARKTSGFIDQDVQSRIYRSLSNRIKTLIQDKKNVIVVSGHDHNLQYIEKDNVYQVISGSGSKVEAARAVYPQNFSYGGTGYAIMDIFTNGKSRIALYRVKDDVEEILFEKEILVQPEPYSKQHPAEFPPIVNASIYTPEMTQKSGFHNFLFGTHYRDYYSRLIKVKTLSLDTIYGGLTPVRAGGGHQSKSLRLADKNGKEYVMRGLKKSATRFLQSVAFKDRYIGKDLENTFAEDFLMDFYTSSHPYTPFIVGDLAEAVGIYHTNPILYYIPKQNVLGSYNEEYGDELYMVEEHPGKEHGDLQSFGSPDDIDGTDKVVENLRKDSKYKIDERAYIRARLFDMLIGDWDRHSDQWRWSLFNEGDSIVYRPIPRDRDQAFPKYGGTLLSILMNIPGIRHMKGYDEDLKNVKWFNMEPYPQDLAFIKSSGENVWLEEAAYIKENLTSVKIDAAFEGLPPEVKGATVEEIKTNLKKRLENLNKYALEYRDVLLKTVVLTGTDGKEKFVITRLPGGITEIKIYSVSKDNESLIHSMAYNREKTREIWIYGLDDDDVFEVSGKPDNPILLRLMGGQNNDVYSVESGRKVRIYDFESKKNTYATDGKTREILTDDYETNSYDIKKPKYDFAAGYPSAGFNPDDGVKIGAAVNYTINRFNRRPYSQKHTVKGNFYFATKGFEIGYRGDFMNIASKWNFGLDLWYTSPTFSINYFGYGNETVNNDDALGMDYNRVKLQVFRVAPSFFRKGRNGSRIDIQAVFETIEVEGSTNRFVNQPGEIMPYLFGHRLFGGLNGRYSFENYDNVSLPALGMSFYIAAGWKTSLDQIERNFPHAEAAINFVHNITADNNLVFATTVKGKALFNDNFEFYQAATLGGDRDLRGYRRERFTGKQALYQSSDLRLTLGNWKSSFIPMKYGVFGGYDYGRVWIENDTSEKWHQSAGGGLWLNGVDIVTARVFYFYGSDGGRIAVGLNFGL